MHETRLLSIAVAAAEGRVLAVSFLLGISADPNTLDRWRGSPMDDALRGGTLYHMYCAKLLQAWGGELARYNGTSQGEEFLLELQKISIKTVRVLVGKLIGQGLDRTKPQRLSDQEALIVMSACAGHMELVVKLKERTAAITSDMSVLTQSIERCGMEVQTHLENMLKVLETPARMSHTPENHVFESKHRLKVRPNTGKRSTIPAVRKDFLTSHDSLIALDLDTGNINAREDNLMPSDCSTDEKPQPDILRKVNSCDTLDMLWHRVGDEGKRQRENLKALRRSQSMVMHTRTSVASFKLPSALVAGAAGAQADPPERESPTREEATLSSLLQTRRFRKRSSLFIVRMHVIV